MDVTAALPKVRGNRFVRDHYWRQFMASIEVNGDKWAQATLDPCVLD
jgi:hypothetical protein